MSIFFSSAVIAAVIIIIAIVVIAAVLLNGENAGRNRGGEHGIGEGSYACSGSRRSGWHLFEPGYKRAGRRGEAAAAKAISGLLGKKERLFTNVSVRAEGGRAELDNIVVNRFGVFIIEVKNYNGYIEGGEEDFEWRKYKMTPAGNTYESSVKNPIKQVKRQVYLLAKYLRYYGSDVWVEGYAFLLQDNSPVESSCILRTPDDIDRAIHTKRRRMLSEEEVEEIARLIGG